MKRRTGQIKGFRIIKKCSGNYKVLQNQAILNLKGRRQNLPYFFGTTCITNLFLGRRRRHESSLTKSI